MAEENVKVIVRCRPMNKRELDLNCRAIVQMNGCEVKLTNPNDKNCPTKQFTFDSVYDMKSATENLYNDICYPLVESVLEGYNSTVFAYGQTGCGKSFTMEGSSTPSSTRGIIPRALEHIFEAISVASDVKFLALVSYLEIYNEQIRDLLMPSEKLNSSMSGLPLKEIPNEGVVVQGLSTHPVHNIQECENLLRIGSKNRIIGTTLMNQNSSRSHSIFTISVEQISKNNCISQNSLECKMDDQQHIKKGKLNLVDLAGSERQTKTGATGDRLKEATKINLSLSALGNVISALVDGKSKHIPYRDSKLTRLLQDSLGGNTRTLMIACISPADNNYDETLSTLRYANRAKNISNQPIVNEDPKDAMLRKYQEEIQKLKEMLQSSAPSINSIENKEVNNNDIEITRPVSEEYKLKLEMEKHKIISEYQDEMNRLKNEHESEKNEKEHLMQEMLDLKTQYENNLAKVNQEMKENEVKIVPKEEIMKRLQAIKASIIGGEKANDEKLKEKRKRKKLAAEKKLHALAQVLARVEQDEDRELLQDQYKDITQELNLKTEGLRKYRHKVKALEREIHDIQGEFETERTDYLETIRKHERTIKLLSQIIHKMVPLLKKDCNYSDIETIKSQAVWNEEVRKWKLPEVIFTRTTLPPAGRINTSQTAPGRLESDSDGESGHESNGQEIYMQDLNNLDNQSDSNTVEEILLKKLEKSEKENIAGNYFKPRRATQLLNNSNNADPAKAFNIWRDFAQKSRAHSSTTTDIGYLTTSPSGAIGSLNNSWNGFTHPPSKNSNLTNLWINGNGVSSPELRRPLRLDALPTIEKRHKNKLNTLDLI
ncbi:kinesin-like protein KIF17 [Chrysoperla carnea]|uniref:kinesin-like protein KIF17 n=1 Tax=Chrysoperla carnea TaxID=189513 RepID=UPI001D06DD28|nr:kinesin-like protein KIF17 [Chrysoperla carnea]